MRKLLTISNFAMVLCVVGVALLFTPWAQAVIWSLDPTPQADGTYKLKSWPPAAESFPGYRFWHATASAATFLALFLLFVVTAPMRPSPRWRSVVVLAGGIAVLAVVLIGMNSEPTVLRSDMNVGRAVQSTWAASNFVALGLAASLMVLAALELRVVTIRATRDSTSLEANSAEGDAVRRTDA